MKTKNFFALSLLSFIMIMVNIKTLAQIVYTDISDTTIFIPDVQFKDSANYYFFDLNDDAINDFRFVATIIYNADSHPIITGKLLGIAQLINDNKNKVAGGCFENGNYTINVGDTISNKLPWSYGQYIEYIKTNDPLECIVPIGDIFFGLKLVVSSDTLYGWVRCCATDTSVTVKDYAYNAFPNSHIIAGQTISGIDTDSLNYLLHINTSYNNLIVDFNGLQPQGNISIINIMGQILQTVYVSGAHNVIPINGFNAGIYIIRVATPQIVFNKSIYLQ